MQNGWTLWHMRCIDAWCISYITMCFETKKLSDLRFLARSSANCWRSSRILFKSRKLSISFWAASISCRIFRAWFRSTAPSDTFLSRTSGGSSVGVPEASLKSSFFLGHGSVTLKEAKFAPKAKHSVHTKGDSTRTCPAEFLEHPLSKIFPGSSSVFLQSLHSQPHSTGLHVNLRLDPVTPFDIDFSP